MPSPPAIDVLKRTLTTSSSPNALAFILNQMTSAEKGTAATLLEEARRHGILTSEVAAVTESPAQQPPPSPEPEAAPGPVGPAGKAKGRGASQTPTPKDKKHAKVAEPTPGSTKNGPSVTASARFAAAAAAGGAAAKSSPGARRK
jgi:hypothetical protein